MQLRRMKQIQMGPRSSKTQTIPTSNRHLIPSSMTLTHSCYIYEKRKNSLFLVTFNILLHVPLLQSQPELPFALFCEAGRDNQIPAQGYSTGAQMHKDSKSFRHSRDIQGSYLNSGILHYSLRQPLTE